MDLVNFFRAIFCMIGLGLSVYALHVEISKSHNDNFKALCDINEHMSCSKVFSSKYGTGFGLIEPVLGKDSPLNVPNSIFGISFYAIVFLMGFSGSNVTAWAMFMFSVVSCLGSVYLGYILYFILHDVCVVCISTYVVNACLLVLNFFTLSRATGMKKTKKE